MKGFKWTFWLKPVNAKLSEYRVYGGEKPYNIDEKGDRYCIHQQEIADLRQAYRNKYPHINSGFLVGSSLVGNKEGDSARFWKLTKECEEQCNG